MTETITNLSIVFEVVGEPFVAEDVTYGVACYWQPAVARWMVHGGLNVSPFHFRLLSCVALDAILTEVLACGFGITFIDHQSGTFTEIQIKD